MKRVGAVRGIRLQVGLLGLCGCSFAILAADAFGQSSGPKPVYGANWQQAFKYSSENLKPYIYDYYVRPKWIGKTDSFVYSFRTSKGTAYYRVDPKKKSKTALFDHAKLAARLSEASRKPVDPHLMTLSSLNIDDKGEQITFVYEKARYSYGLKTGTLKKLGKATTTSRYQQLLDRLEQSRKGGRISEEQYQRYRKFYLDRMKSTRKPEPQPQPLEPDPQQKKKTGSATKKPAGKKSTSRFSYRVYSPDRKQYVYAKQHNLYLVTIGKDKKAKAILLTKDGAENYSFGASGDRLVRPRVFWSKDSRAFYIVRADSRGMKELWLVSSLSEPRPTLQKYPYAMPGEEHIRKSELYYYHRESNALRRVEPKWRDEAYVYPQWGKNGDELRFIRRDRLRRNIELCSVDTHTGSTTCLIREGFEDTIVHFQSPRVLKSDEMIWWSERTGWGHFYLYTRDGQLKNAITAGPWRASRIVSVDEKKRLLYFYGNAREKGENVYLEHLYRVGFDGRNLVCLTPGNAQHGATLSPTRQFLVDSCSRTDMPPVSVLRDASGKLVMPLEKMDLSRLQKAGWQLPETFVVKAADGVTDLYGNMWKPFDFNPSRRYPLIANVYPGPQQEGVSHVFSASNTRQQLAQLGFIVIQVGHRGGSPRRSKAYHRFSYFNMRDFGLADKKTAIEQLAERFPFIDIERVGIYGHSGGGFMSAAAMLQKPYNEFFKVAVASSGNHDNNIYNNSWAERYHGLREVPAETASQSKQSANGAKPVSTAVPVDIDPDDAVRAVKPRRKAVVAIKPKHARKSKKTEKKETSKSKATGKADVKKKAIVAKRPPPKTKFEIKVPTNAELAANLKGHLLLVHGEIDNNVHPANTYRLVDALIKANKRFDMLILPGKRHSFGSYTPYFQQRLWEYFAEHLLNDRQHGADIYDKKHRNNQRTEP